MSPAARGDHRLERRRQETDLRWHEGSLFSPPLNTWRATFQRQRRHPRPAVLGDQRAVGHQPLSHFEFVFDNGFAFTDRFDSRDNYFSGQGRSYSGRVWETNFVPDVRSFALKNGRNGAPGAATSCSSFRDNTMASHIFRVSGGTYKKAHRHGPGAHVVIIGGAGYSLMWPKGRPCKGSTGTRGASSSLRDVVSPAFQRRRRARPLPGAALGQPQAPVPQALRHRQERQGGRATRSSTGTKIPTSGEMFEQALADQGIESRMADAYRS